MSYLYNKRNNKNDNNKNIEFSSLPTYSHDEWNERKRRWQSRQTKGPQAKPS